MGAVFKISEAASMAIHTIVMLAEDPKRRLSAGRMAQDLQVSEAHLSKVLQRLAHANLVQSVRGPGGGFVIRKKAGAVSLLDVYEMFDGPLAATDCVFGSQPCGGKQCVLGGVLKQVHRDVYDYLAGAKVAGVAARWGRKENARA